MGKTTNADGFAEFAESLSKVVVSAEAKEVAEIYGNAKKAMIVFSRILLLQMRLLC